MMNHVIDTNVHHWSRVIVLSIIYHFLALSLLDLLWGLLRNCRLWASYRIRKITGCACEWRERFPRHRGLAIPTCITWCIPGSLTNGFHWSRWRGKRSRLSRRMHNFKRPMLKQLHVVHRGSEGSQMIECCENKWSLFQEVISTSLIFYQNVRASFTLVGLVPKVVCLCCKTVYLYL